MADEGPLVGILTGSGSDLPAMQQAAAILDKLEIPAEINVISAHRSPDRLDEYMASAEQRGLRVLICGAGLAAHLAGAVAARTVLGKSDTTLCKLEVLALQALNLTFSPAREGTTPAN